MKEVAWKWHGRGYSDAVGACEIEREVRRGMRQGQNLERGEGESDWYNGRGR